jgi:hypothetical protein
MDNRNIWAILAIVVIAVLAVWYFMASGTQAPGAAGTAATTTPNGTVSDTGVVTPPGTQAGERAAPSSAGTGATQGRTYSAQVTVTGFTATSQTGFPLVNYKVDSALAGDGFFSLIGQNTNTVVWGKNQKIAGTYTLDPNQIDVQGNEPSHKLSEGDYFIRITDSSGAIVGESRPFRIAVGQVTNN